MSTTSNTAPQPVKAALRTTRQQAPVVDAEVLPDEQSPTGNQPGVESTGTGLSNIDADFGAGPAPTTTAVAERPSTAVESASPNRFSESSDGALEGDWDNSDRRFPRLQIVNGSGKLSEKWNQGTTLFAEEQLLPVPDPRTPNPAHTFKFVPIWLRKQFRENLSQEEMASGLSARIVSSIREVESLGGTTQWIGKQKPSWSPSAQVLMLVARPDVAIDHPGFDLELDGTRYGLAMFYASGTAFALTAKLIFNQAQTSLLVPVLDGEGKPTKNERGFPVKKTMLYKHPWSWSTVKKAFDKFAVFVPDVKLDVRNQTGPELRAYAAELLETVAATAHE